MLEPGQSWETAALIASIRVCFYFVIKYAYVSRETYAILLGDCMTNYYMEEAIGQAKKAYKNGEIPVGAVIVRNNKIIAKSYNKVEKEGMVISHAEINAIKIATKKLKNWRLLDCDMYVTLEPCPMCSWAIKLSRIKNVYYCTSKIEHENSIINKIKIDDYEKYCTDLLKDFFKDKR